MSIGQGKWRREEGVVGVYILKTSHSEESREILTMLSSLCPNLIRSFQFFYLFSIARENFSVTISVRIVVLLH